MKFSNLFLLALLFVFACKNQIKDNDAHTVVEEGTNFDSLPDPYATIRPVKENKPQESAQVSSDEIATDGSTFWVGFFNPHEEVNMREKTIVADEALYWSRRNKISISIDTVIGDSVIGHSVVAGNDRPFYGRVDTQYTIQSYHVKEPGDHRYDGEFTFKIEDGKLTGEWDAYNPIDIPKRSYSLEKKVYQYDPDIKLSKAIRYANWGKFIKEGNTESQNTDDEFYGWVRREFAASTNKIFEINASNTELTEKDVENLTNSDLVVIRNTIYARHGYSFKNRPLRVFFDQQEWYIPVHADIKADFTELEKKNIQLLLRYEKNAKEYYDYFGRG